MRAQVLAALASHAAVVLDADALTSFAGEPHALAQALAAHSAGGVLTPHTGEFDKLFMSIAENSKLNSKLEKARAAAREQPSTIVLKGADTVVAARDGRASIADNAPATLATAGTGDVLAGMIAGLLAQGMPAFEAASAAVWLHGKAAREFGPGLIAEDVPEMLPKVLGELQTGLVKSGKMPV